MSGSAQTEFYGDWQVCDKEAKKKQNNTDKEAAKRLDTLRKKNVQKIGSRGGCEWRMIEGETHRGKGETARKSIALGVWHECLLATAQRAIETKTKCQQ